MSTTVLVVLELVIYVVMYVTYGRNLQNKIIRVDKDAPSRTPRKHFWETGWIMCLLTSGC